MKHIIVDQNNIEAAEYHPKGRKPVNFPFRENEESHARKILEEYTSIVDSDDDVKGFYLRFESSPGYDLNLDSLDNARNGHLVNVKEEEIDNGVKKVSALLYVKKDKKRWLDKKIEGYLTKTTKKSGERCNKNLIESIEHIVKADVKNFFSYSTPPGNERKWLEAWFRVDTTNDDELEKQDIVNTLNSLHIEYDDEQMLTFPELIVILIKVNNADIVNLSKQSSKLMKFETCEKIASFLDGQGKDNEIWKDLILEEVSVVKESSTYVCIIDGGVNRAHPLLELALSPKHWLAVDPQWGPDDKRRDSHGTNMAGLALYGDLTDIYNGKKVASPYRLASVKFLPNQGYNQKELWGSFTSQAVSRAEIALPDKNIIYCMAVTADKDNNILGFPTSWSAEVDKICSDKEHRHLFLISAGNIPEEWKFLSELWFPEKNMKELPVQSPAHAWNALTVGAYTDKCITNNTKYAPLAIPGGFSPYSATSVMWNDKTPIKPDVVMEGGNLGYSSTEQPPYAPLSDLALITTSRYFKPNSQYFDAFHGTSPATALASRYAALVALRYPNLWPETIRALFVQSAEYTDTMLSQFPDRRDLLRSCGFGKPNLQKMLESQKDGVTFIVQHELQPYKMDSKSVSYNEENIIALPWPRETLLSMDTEVKVTVCLSYFIEPAPGDFSTFVKYPYASAGLQFDIVRHPDIKVKWESGGPKKRKGGSIFKDCFKMPSADLAVCNQIRVYPTTGWWRTRKSLARYGSKI